MIVSFFNRLAIFLAAGMVFLIAASEFLFINEYISFVVPRSYIYALCLPFLIALHFKYFRINLPWFYLYILLIFLIQLALVGFSVATGYIDLSYALDIAFSSTIVQFVFLLFAPVIFFDAKLFFRYSVFFGFSALFFVLYTLTSRYSTLASSYLGSYYRGDVDFYLDVHYFPDYFSILALIFMAMSKRGWIYLYVSAFAMAALLGSRTSLVGLLLGLLIYYFTLSRADRRHVGSFFRYGSFFTIALGVILFLINQNSELDVYKLAERLFGEEGYSQAFGDRGNIFFKSFENTSASCLLFGCPGFELVELSSKGAYIHNWLSYLFSYGAFLFFSTVVLFLFPFRGIFLGRRRYKKMAPVLLFLLFTIILSRAYVWSFWALLISFVYLYIYQEDKIGINVGLCVSPAVSHTQRQ